MCGADYVWKVGVTVLKMLFTSRPVYDDVCIPVFKTQECNFFCNLCVQGLDDGESE